MATIEDQLALEHDMVRRGADSYSTKLRYAEEHGRGADTGYARRLMDNLMLPLIETLQAFLDKKSPGVNGKVRTLLKRIDAGKSMYIALRTVFNAFTHDEQVVHTASRIGRQVEDEARFSRFQEMHGDYYDAIIKDFKRKGTEDYRFMHRVLTKTANDYADQWVPWTTQERVAIGMRLLDMILTTTDLLEKTTVHKHGKSQVILTASASAKEWVTQHEEVTRLLFPDRSPCIIEPDKWAGLNQGGYYSPQMRAGTPLVMTRSRKQRQALEASDLTELMQTVNIVQEVPWAVNIEVLSIAKAVWAKNLGIGMPNSEQVQPAPNPLKDVLKENMTEAQQAEFLEWKLYASEVYTLEKQRVGKSFQTTRIIRMANEFSLHSRFWFVWYCDFRGRLYTATAGFSPQGPDLAKGLLQFNRGKPLGVRGLYWLKVHGANRFGYDKVSYDERVRWVDDNERYFIAAADDPLSHTDVWGKADKPWQFLAFLFEYKAALAAASVGLDFVSRLPIGLDGSCNGLQHFSAMLRDPVGGRATNLVDGDKPSDIYTQVAAVAHGKLSAQHERYSDWLDFCKVHGEGKVPRALAKRPVMTLPYGATRQSCTQYIHQSILETHRDFFTASSLYKSSFSAACDLTPILWGSIGDVVVAARSAMDWLQKAATSMNRIDKHIQWTTPDGFTVVQDSRKIETMQIETQLQGRFQCRVGEYTDEIDKSAQRNGISPNFVHSLDGTHLRATVRIARDAGITDFACIHDDYGTHAADTDRLHQCIRQAFVNMYANASGPLERFRAELEAAGAAVDPVPPKGTLDINEVLSSRYFFG